MSRNTTSGCCFWIAATAAAGLVSVPTTSILPVLLRSRTSRFIAKGSSSTRNARMVRKPRNGYPRCCYAMVAGGGQLCPFSENVRKARLQIGQTVTCGKLIQKKSRAGVANADLHEIISRSCVNLDLSSGQRGSDRVFDAVFHERLYCKRGNRNAQQVVRNVNYVIEPLSQARLLDLQIVSHYLRFFAQRYETFGMRVQRKPQQCRHAPQQRFGSLRIVLNERRNGIQCVKKKVRLDF